LVIPDSGNVLPESTIDRVISAISVGVRPFRYAAMRKAEAR
jgi:hypothetical protein